MMQRLKHKQAVITGAALGLEQAMVQRLFAEVAHILIGDMNLDGAKETAGSMSHTR
jgi:NAD(P)-dependent dehydrogenase (short-subunit alcohol dehydrogenase family)